MVTLCDTLTFDGSARICRDGSLVAEVFAARTGLQDYTGSEVDPDNAHGLKDQATVKIYRPESEVFKTDSMATYAGAAVTINHPADMVDADNWKRLGVGEVNGDIARDGQRIRVPIIVRDAAAVKSATTTHKQVSMGYETELVFPTDGKHPDGTACDAYQTNLKINHLAFVPAARGGPELRVVDERPTTTEKPVMKTMLIDGLTVDVSNADTAIATINTILAARDAATTQVTDLTGKVSTLTAEGQTKDAKITTLEQQVKDAKPTPAQLRDAGKALLIVADKAKSVGVAVTDAMDESQIMAATVAKHMGDAAKDWTVDQIAASFAVLTKDAKPAQVFDGSAFRGGIVATGDAETAFVDAQRKASEERRNAWKTPAVSAAA